MSQTEEATPCSRKLGSVQKVYSGRKHLPELDALRGLAAFAVLMNHFHQLWLSTTHPKWIARPKLNPLLWVAVDGHSSVILFFLLSGFVLAFQRLQSPSQTYPQYVLRRVCRIYLPYIASLLLAITACFFCWGRTQYAAPISEVWQLPPDRTSILEHLSVITRFDVYRYDVPFWSLVHEMRISLLFPLIFSVSARVRFRSAIVIAAACTVLASLSLTFVEIGLRSSARQTAFSLTLSYCGTFLIGAALARRYKECSKALTNTSRMAKAALLALALVCYLYPPPLLPGVDCGDFIISIGGVILLAFALHIKGRIARLLRMAPLQFMGRCSFSLYLVHFPILLVLAYTFYGHLSVPSLFVLFITVTFLVATIMYYSVEVPSIKIGRLLSDFARSHKGKAPAVR